MLRSATAFCFPQCLRRVTDNIPIPASARLKGEQAGIPSCGTRATESLGWLVCWSEGLGLDCRTGYLLVSTVCRGITIWKFSDQGRRVNLVGCNPQALIGCPTIRRALGRTVPFLAYGGPDDPRADQWQPSLSMFWT